MTITEDKALRRKTRERELAKATKLAAKKLGTSLYNVIYADPPWRFEPYSRETGLSCAADNHYPTMTLAKIKAIEPPSAKDCALFLWATVPMLPDALDTMAAWGFKYKSHWVWIKQKDGTGYWSRNRHELLLIGTRGSIPAPSPGTQPPSALSYNTTRHSAKPHEFRGLIDRFYPNVPKLEMFARGEAPRGWHFHGNEVTNPGDA